MDMAHSHVRGDQRPFSVRAYSTNRRQNNPTFLIIERIRRFEHSLLSRPQQATLWCEVATTQQIVVTVHGPIL
jgi:hypothetical protein